VRDFDLWVHRGQVAADHHLDQLTASHLLHRPGADEGPVAQGGDAIGDPGQLVQPVRDVDDPDSAAPQVADDAEEVLHLAVAQGRRRLVHDDDLRVRPDRLRDLDELLLGHRQPSRFHRGVDLGADSCE
jgi:hypothetical protein